MCNQERRDIKRDLLRAVQKAEAEIFFSIYALTDDQLIKALNQKAEKGLPIQIWTDTKHQKSLKKKLNGQIELLSRPQKGLMHHKILLLDQTCYLGSTNLTPTSLRMHDNLMLKIDSPPLSFALKAMLENTPQQAKFQSREMTLYLLPHRNVLFEILSALENAQSEILAAFFTFTHPELAEALIKAKERGVRVKVLIDSMSSQGASSKTAKHLKEQGVEVFTNRGSQLMHHKMCFIDQKKFIFGSCNWTKSAFKKNNDFITFLDDLSKNEKKWIKSLFKHLYWESKTF